MAERKCALYLVTHRESGRNYVGVSVRPLLRWAQHKCDAKRLGKTYFHKALLKYGPGAFDWKVLCWAVNAKTAFALERAARFVGIGTYNLTDGGDMPPGFRGPHTEASRRLIGSKFRGRKHTDAHREAISRGLKGKPKTLAHNAAVSAALTGKTLSVATRAKISQDQRGRKRSPEFCAKISQALRNRPPISDATRAKLASAKQAWWERKNNFTAASVAV